MEQIGQIAAQLVLAERARNQEVGLAALAIGAEQERGPIALGTFDHDKAAEDVAGALADLEALLREYAGAGAVERAVLGPSRTAFETAAG